jgi:hypothetical protein
LRAHHWHLYSGSYLTSYNTFFPLLFASYNGDNALDPWATMMAYQIAFGTQSSGAAEITAGATAGGLLYVPLSLHFGTNSQAQSVPADKRFSMVAGTYLPGAGGSWTYVPIAGVAGTNPSTQSNFEVDAFQPAFTPIACIGTAPNGSLVKLSVSCPAAASLPP